MTAAAATLPRLPFGRIAASYLIAVPLAWFASETSGLPWDASIAGFAAGIGWLMGLAPWWLAINAVFVPALSFGLSLDFSPAWALGAFVTLVLVYGAIWKNRVPLFFTSTRALDALAAILPKGPVRFLDVGCGDARVLARLASMRPESRFEGVEQAFLPWLLGSLRARWGAGDCGVFRSDLWAADLSRYDVVYAYLSPAVMPHLWEKAQREMRPGSTLVSAFAVPGIEPAEVVEVADALSTRLHVWHMGERSR